MNGEILNQKEIIINAYGYKDTKRKTYDGITYFGINRKKDIFKVDVELNMTVNDEYDNVLFFIYYSKDRQKYFIRTNYKHNSKEVEALPHVLAKVKDTCVCFN